MERTIFEAAIVDGFKTRKTESIAMTSNGKRLFVGTSEGSLLLYECKPDMTGSTKYSCAVLDTIKKVSKEKRPAVGLLVVESWRTLLAIIDGNLVAYDSQFFQLLGSITDVKGAHLFAVNENRKAIVVVAKKRLFVFSWMSPGFSFKREFSLSDVPRSVLYIRDCVILGFRRHYECLEVLQSSSGVASRIIDVEKDTRTISTKLPANALRSEAILLSLGLQGIVVDAEKVLDRIGGSSQSSVGNGTQEERIEWAAPPHSINCVVPFILSLLVDCSVQVHDLGNLLPLQRISLSGSLSNGPSQSTASSQLSFCTCLFDTESNVGHMLRGSEHVNRMTELCFCSTGEMLQVMRMLPIQRQVDEMIVAGRVEEAIQLCLLCAPISIEQPTAVSQVNYAQGVDLAHLHELCARQLCARGDFDKAIDHFIDATKTDVVQVLALFPDFIPAQLHEGLAEVFHIDLQKESRDQNINLEGVVLERAAAALVHYLDFQRPKILRRVQLAQSIKDSGIVRESGVDSSRFQSMQLNEDDDEGMIKSLDNSTIDPDEEFRRAELLDTALLYALVHCSPSRRSAVVQLLSAPTGNYCQVESCAVLLASQGNSYTEPLLWLYRSHDQHTRVLEALKEDKSVAIGGWNRDQFYQWSADYLRWLWYSETPDISLPKQALHSMCPLFEYDAELGLSVLLCRPASSGSRNSKASFGGKGLTISEVIAFLRSVQAPNQHLIRKATPFGASTGGTWSSGSTRGSIGGGSGSVGSGTSWRYGALAGSAALQAVVACTPLLNGHALAVAFLECIVSSGEAPASLHDEFAQLLVEGLPLDDELEQVLSTQQSKVREIHGSSSVGLLHAANDLRLPQETEHGSGASESIGWDDTALQPLLLYKVYRHKLQNFLQNSSEFHPEKVMRFLPPQYKHETALVLSKLGRHAEVIGIYVHDLSDLGLAENYCDRIYRTIESNAQNTDDSESTDAVPGSLGLGHDAGEIYMILFKVLLEHPENDEDEPEDISQQGLENVIKLALKYFDRVDPTQVLELLPSHTPVASILRYLQVVLEFGGAKKRNLQIIHQLLRVREVQMRTASAKSSSQSSAPSMQTSNTNARMQGSNPFA